MATTPELTSSEARTYLSKGNKGRANPMKISAGCSTHTPDRELPNDQYFSITMLFLSNEGHNISMLLDELSFKNFIFQNFLLPWQMNKMAAGHKT